MENQKKPLLIRPSMQAVTKCCNVATPLRGTTYFARHKMEDVNDEEAFFLVRRDECLFLSKFYIAKVPVYGESVKWCLFLK